MKMNVNGKLVNADDPIITAKDRGLLLGDGLFETLRVKNGDIEYAEAHYNRLKKSADFFSILLPFSFSEMLQMMKNLVSENALSDASIRLTLTRGTGPRGVLPPKNSKSTFFILAEPLLSIPTTSTALLIDHIRRNEFSTTTKHKTLNYLDNIVAAQYAKKNGAAFAILQNTKGHLACAHCANIFLDIDGEIFTPRIEDGALPGIIRHNLIQNQNVICKTIPASLLYKAKNIFLTNSLMHKVTVNLIDAL